jgi:hypothetical protein
MKTIVAFILLIGFVIAEADAQTEKGSFMIGGSGYVQRSKQHVGNGPPVGNNPLTSFGISPTVGYFPVKNLMTGIITSETLSVFHQTGFKSSSNSFSIGPIIRYYFPFAGKFAVFPEASAVYNRSTGKSSGQIQGVPSDEKYKTEYFNYRAGVGLAWFVASNVGIEAIFVYRQNNPKAYNSFTSYTGVTLGIQFYLPRKN